jgi:uncharacterized membrane protein
MNGHEQRTEQPLDAWFEAAIRRGMRGFKTKIMAGLAVVVPLWITLWVLQTIFHWADGFSAPLVKRAFGVHIPGVGFFLTFLLLWLCGVCATNVLGKRLLRLSRDLLERLPLVRTIYGPVQQLLETITSPDKAHFRRVVLVEYPRQGLWTLGFVAGDIPYQLGAKMAHSIFIPTAPNPTTGFMLIVPAEHVYQTTLDVEDAFQMIVSGGIVVPPSFSLDGLMASPVIPTT